MVRILEDFFFWGEAWLGGQGWLSTLDSAHLHSFRDRLSILLDLVYCIRFKKRKKV